MKGSWVDLVNKKKEKARMMYICIFFFGILFFSILLCVVIELYALSSTWGGETAEIRASVSTLLKVHVE